MSTTMGKKICDLKVAELKQELEKRGLEKSGVKGVLVDRLTQAILKEGINPDDYVMNGASCKTQSPAPPEVSAKADTDSGESVSAVPKIRVKVEPPLIELDDDDGQPDGFSGYDGNDSNADGTEGTDAGGDNKVITTDQDGNDEATVNDDNKVSIEAEVEESENNDDAGAGGEADENEPQENDEGDGEDQDENWEEQEGEEGEGAIGEEENPDDYIEGDQQDEDMEGEENESAEIMQEGGENNEEVESENAEGVVENKVNADDNENMQNEEQEEPKVVAEEQNTKVEDAKTEAIDDEMDQDALHLTIGEDEEEDKNYILAEERDKDKPDEETEKPQNDADATTSKKNVEPAKKEQLVVKSQKTIVKSSSSKDSKPQTVEVKGKNTLAKSQASKTKSAPTLKEQLKDLKTTPREGPSPKKSEPKTSNSQRDKFPKSEKGPPVSSNAPKTKGGKNPKDRDPAKDNKGQPKVNKPEPRHVDRRIIVKTRPSRPFEKQRPVIPGRPKRRSVSPRVRRIDNSHRQTLSFDQIREMRERERQREREREMHRRMRERERRERDELARQREIERRNAEELALLERERQRLRIEREKVEREKEELIRLEKERQRAERERIEREKEEIRRAKIDDRSHRSQKRSFEDERERGGSRDYTERKKLATAEPRHHERSYPEAAHSSARSHAAAASTDRRGSDSGRHERDRGSRRRSRSRSFSPVRDTSHSRAPRQHFPEREVTSRVWPLGDDVREPHRREKEVPKEKRLVDDRRDIRIARERDVAPSAHSSRGPSQPEYGSTTREDLVQHHRSSSSSSSTMKRSGADRYDVVKNDPSFPANRDDHWMRRAAYGIATTSNVSATQISSSLPSRDTWLSDRKSDWQISDSRVSVRPISDMPNRWVTGSGNTINTSGRNVSMASHVAQIVPAPPPIYNQHSSVALSSGSIPSQTYSNDRYGAYSSKPTFRRY